MSDVTDNSAEHRFELDTDGLLSAAYYERHGDVITFTHTEVPKELGGRGIGSRLIKGALAQVAAAGLKVVPQCPFVKAYLEKHPGEARLA
jgi:predicted GNAT family acetyltransferase